MHSSGVREGRLLYELVGEDDATAVQRVPWSPGEVVLPSEYGEHAVRGLHGDV